MSDELRPSRSTADDTPEPTRRIRSLRARLLSWYERHARDLPWRRTRDPYRIWVAEVMLQQTQVATVLPYYERFMGRFPDPAALARADEEEVLAAWSGLGYYRRARALQAGARVVAEVHGGKLPDDAAALRELPGVGRYTAGAVASIAFGLPEPVLDGNVRRVLSRIFDVDGQVVGRAREHAKLWELAGRLARCPRPGELNQSLMELGALVCTPRRPGCTTCPARSLCRARARGRTKSLPAPRPSPPVTEIAVEVAWLVRAGRVLLERPGDGSPLRGAWDLPAVERSPQTGVGRGRALADGLRRRHGLEVRVDAPAARATHGIMNRRLRLEFFPCRLVRGRVAGQRRLRWLEPTDLLAAAVSGATRKGARCFAI